MSDITDADVERACVVLRERAYFTPLDMVADEEVRQHVALSQRMIMRVVLERFAFAKGLANHDPAQVVVMGRKDVAKVREALEAAASVTGRNLEEMHGMVYESLSLLPAEEMRT